MTYTLELDAFQKLSITINLYRNVKNLLYLQKELATGSLFCCIVNPTLIVHPFQIVVAANKILMTGKITTKSFYTQILFNLSISHNITQSLKTFGLNINNTDILVAVVHPIGSLTEVKDADDKIEGDKVDISCLKDITCIQSVKEHYKLDEIEINSLSILDSVITKIATKDVAL